MPTFSAPIQRFEQKGEKSGWTYILIPSEIAEELMPGHRKSFRVKGKLDKFRISNVALLPMGGGDFILPLNAAFRKGIGKRHGAMVSVQLSVDTKPFEFNADFMACLNDEPQALEFFKSLPGSHQRYFSKWIDDAKTIPTRTRRIAQAVNGLAKRMGYGEMIRSGRVER